LIRMIWLETFLIFHQCIITQLLKNCMITQLEMKFSDRLLACMLIAFNELHRRRSGHHLKNVNIIVFRRDENSNPSIPENSIKRMLAFTSRLLED